MSVDFAEMQKKIDNLINAKNKSEGAITVLEEQIANYKQEIAEIQENCSEKFDCTIEELAENLETDEAIYELIKKRASSDQYKDAYKVK